MKLCNANVILQTAKLSVSNGQQNAHWVSRVRQKKTGQEENIQFKCQSFLK